MKKLQTGKVVKPEDFLGREKMIKELNTLIGLGQSVVLIAPRRFGKTSLITKIIDMQQNEYHSISVDLMKIYSKRLLAEHIIDEVYKIMGVQGIIHKLKDASMSLFQDLANHLTSLEIEIGEIKIATTGDLFKANNEDKLLEHALELPDIIAEKMGIRIIFSIDEFGEVDKFQSKNELLEKMRSIFQHQNNIVFLFAGSQYSLMTKIFTDENSAFYKFATLVNVPTMKAEEFSEAFSEVFYQREVSIPKNFSEEIESIGGGVPYYMVRVAQQVLIDAKINDNLNVYSFSIKRAAIKVFTREQSYFISELNKLKGKKYDFIALKAIASNENHTKVLGELGVARQNANNVIISLINSGFVVKEGGYKIVDPFLSRFVKNISK